MYPELKDAIRDSLLVHEASVERSGLRRLIAQRKGAAPDPVIAQAKRDIDTDMRATPARADFITAPGKHRQSEREAGSLVT